MGQVFLGKKSITLTFAAKLENDREGPFFNKPCKFKTLLIIYG
jgi:hypothetical protein